MKVGVIAQREYSEKKSENKTQEKNKCIWNDKRRENDKTNGTKRQFRSKQKWCLRS